tara:strand:- start:184 stop:324 length:141 start_codon:yes stop_codon:yes gene_type:complete
MPFIGEQPNTASTLYVVARSGTLEVEVSGGYLEITTRSGTTNVGVT